MSVSRARRLLGHARAERSRLRRHLLVAAALREILEHEPIVVGGTAEEFHTAAPYHETDLDLVGRVSRKEAALLRSLGFERRGRHWVHRGSKVAVEFPGALLDGDPERVDRRRIRGGLVAVIGVDDLYLDRLRQATANPVQGSIEHRSALAVCAAAFDRIDWRYVEGRIRTSVGTDPSLGTAMRAVDRRVRRTVRRALG